MFPNMSISIGRETITHLLHRCTQLRSHTALTQLHSIILRSGFSHDTFILNRLVDLYSKCGADLASSLYLFNQSPKRDLFSWNAMLGGYLANGELVGARKVFDEMPERNVVSWNSMISGFVRNGEEGKGIECYGEMVRGGFVPNRFTLASVLGACGVLREVRVGRVCNGMAVKVGVDGNVFVGNALVNVYAKCGCVGDAVKAFAALEEPNEVSFTALMGGLAEAERVEEALDMFRLMHRMMICIDAVSLSMILGVCVRCSFGECSYCDRTDGHVLVRAYGKLIHSLSVKLGLENDFHLSNSMLDMYVKSGDMADAEMLFDRLSTPNIVSWNIMIAGYGLTHKVDKAIKLMENMEGCGVEPDEVTFINLLSGCIKDENVVVGRLFFARIACPTLSSWNAMLSAYSQVENHEEVITLFREMQFRTMKPDKTTLVVVLGSCVAMGLLDLGKQVHAVSQKYALNANLFIGSALISLYSRSSWLERALFIFESLPQLDTACWNSLIAGFSLNHMHDKAFAYFNAMRGKDIFPTQFSYATLLSCCAAQPLPCQGRQMHALIVKDGNIVDVFVGSALIDMYCKSGDVDAAQITFDSMPCKNRVSWNAMIHGYAQNGRGDEAVHLYHEMVKSGEEPDDVTFVAVLTSCSHAGLVDEGLRIFESISSEYGTKPLLDHCTCIIDALGRAGRLQEAEALILKMPYKEDPIIWEVLLSSCRVHSDIPVARRAADILFALNPKNRTPYVLLGNVYSSMGRWDDTRTVRELMCDENVHKEPGYSCL
ncbi:hypothetical protein Drorol1_Dr00004308 [Drosera rotundifolia]